MSVKKTLILPNYQQSPEIPVLVQQAPGERWKLSDYSSERPAGLPKGAGRGLPRAIVEQNNRSSFVLGRIVRQQNPVVFLACQAGQDKTGRIPFLTLMVSGALSSLDVGEESLNIPDDALDCLINTPSSPVPAEQIPALKAAIATLNKRGDAASQAALQKMWKNFQDKRQYSYFTSVPFRGAAAYVPDSEAACFGGGRENIGPFSRKQVMVGGVVVLLLFFLLLHQCHSSQPVHQPKGEEQSLNVQPTNS